MLKTVKGKVIAGTVAVTLLAGTGAAFGSGFALDAGQKLGIWYTKEFLKSSGEMTKEVKRYTDGKVPGLATEYENLKIDATTEINNKKSEESTAKTTSIGAEAQAHIDKINAKELAISDYMDNQFDGLLGAANLLINGAGDEATKYANKNLGEHTGGKGTAALTDLTTELTTATTTAADALTAEISAAKTALQNQLDSEKAITTEQIKAAIDAKIVALTTSITDKKDELVVAQQALITAKAVELENTAKAQLKTIVNGI